MSRFLLSTVEVEDQLEMLLRDIAGAYAFEAEVANALARMVDSYQVTQNALVLDALIGIWADKMDCYLAADAICETFSGMIAACYDPTEQRVELDYDRRTQTLMVTAVPLPRPDPVQQIKETYQHARVQGDFYPERMRRALDELATYV